MRGPVLLIPLLLALLLPSGALAATPWTPARVFTSSPDTQDPIGAASPRVGLADDGTAVLAYRRITSIKTFQTETRAVAGGPRGGFRHDHLITRRQVSSFSAAAQPGGDRIVAYVANAGIFTAVRHRGHWRTHRVLSGERSGIDGVQVATDPKGGWVLAATRFAKRETRVQAVDLRQDGRASGSVQELGLGSFGNEARPVFALSVDQHGLAVLAVRVGGDASDPGGTAVRTRAHGERFESAAMMPGVFDARVTPTGRGGAILAGTEAVRTGDVGTFGGPVSVRVTPAGRLIDRHEPVLPQPGRAFGPSAVALDGNRRMLVFNLKDGPAAFSNVAPVAAVGFTPSGRAGTTRTLTDREASEPAVVPLANDRAVAIWAGSNGWGATRTSSTRILRPIKAPPGPPPGFVHENRTNRDIRSAGRFVAVAWERSGRVRVSLRSL